LCKGLFIKPKTQNEELLGVVSAFLDDTYYVELARRDDVDELVEARSRYAFEDVTPRIFETSKAGAERFALVVGPFDKSGAERLRWALLERKQQARVSVGEDFVGPPQPHEH
jgi:hypothetical protein